MNVPISIVDENGSFHNMTIGSDFVSELAKMMRVEGITPIHTMDDNGNKRTYNVQAFVLMSKGCKGNMMFLPND